MPQTKEISFADSGSEFFENLLDIINPLQHIPGVSTIYRAITGDQIAAPARLIGGALFGGPLGFASEAANLFFEEASGDDLAGHALALVGAISDAPELAEAVVPTAFAPPTDEHAPDVMADPVSAAARPQPRAATESAAAGDGVEIIWNSPRVLPSLARASSAPAGAAQSDAAKPHADSPPAWLGAAIADAQSVHSAAQLGKATQKVDAQPWIADAMIQALDKYEALSRQRGR